jgi:methyltransferase family protein
MTALRDRGLRRLANGYEEDSLSNRMRARRFGLFEGLAAPLPRPLRILDVGGTNEFWEHRGWAGREDVQITLLNLAPQRRRHENIVPVVGDATAVEAEDRAFDVAFSNSVIEHLFDAASQRAMAREIQRVGRAYWVQTPNFWFPIEPHFLMPGWQWLPESTRVAIIRRRACGWRGPCEDADEARSVVREIRLLRRRELRKLFPGARIVAERFGGAVKSWIALDGFPSPSPTARS